MTSFDKIITMFWLQYYEMVAEQLRQLSACLTISSLLKTGPEV